MISNIKTRQRLMSLLAGAVIGMTPIAANAETKGSTGFTLVKQEMKIEKTDLNIEDYTVAMEETYNYLAQFIDYEDLQRDLQCLYYLSNVSLMSVENKEELQAMGIIYDNEHMTSNFDQAFRLLNKIRKYNDDAIKSNSNNLINPSKLCYDEHDQNLVSESFGHYVESFHDEGIVNDEYNAAFKQLTTLNAYEQKGNTYELSEGGMWIDHLITGRLIIKMFEYKMLRDYSIDELSQYFVREELEKGIFMIREDVSLDLNCLSDLEVIVFNYGEMLKFSVDDSNKQMFKLFKIFDYQEPVEVIEETKEEIVQENDEYVEPTNYTEGVFYSYNYLTKYINYDHLQSDLQCLYYLSNIDHLSEEERNDLIASGIVYETNFETEEGLQNFMQAFSLINIILDFNQSVIRDDYENGTMDINHLIDPSMLCFSKEGREFMHEMHVRYFNAYKNGRFLNEDAITASQEIVACNQVLNIGNTWLARNVVGGDYLQMLRDDMQEDFKRKQLDKFFNAKELNRGQWFVKDKVKLNSDSTDELEQEVINFQEVFGYVYDNVNNDIMGLFQVMCK